MADIPKIVLPHGGYRNLIVYRKSDVIYQGTIAFCRRFLPPHGDRTVDQMTQARPQLQAEHCRGKRGERHEQGNGNQTHQCGASNAGRTS